MPGRLLIIGGTITPYREVQDEQDRLLDRFLSAFDGRPEKDTGSLDRSIFRFDLEPPYFPQRFFAQDPSHKGNLPPNSEAFTTRLRLLLRLTPC